MLSRRFCTAALSVPLIATGCAGLQEPTGKYVPIPIADFVDSLKCDYATYIVNYYGKHLPLKGWPVTGTMDLNVLVGEDSNASAGAIIPFQGGSTTFGVSNSVSRKKTAVTTITFLLDSDVKDTTVCDKVTAKNISEGIGFGKWLFGIAGELDDAVEGPPKFGVSQLDYQLVFSVERKVKANGSVSLAIVPLSLSADQAAYRNDVQTIKIRLVPNEIVVGHDKNGKPIKKKNVKLFNVPATDQLSGLVLAQ